MTFFKSRAHDNFTNSNPKFVIFYEKKEKFSTEKPKNGQ